jgi:hypothetical protein
MHRRLAVLGMRDFPIPDTAVQPARPVIAPIFAVTRRDFPRWVEKSATKLIAKTLAKARVKPGPVVLGIGRSQVILRTVVVPDTGLTGTIAALVRFQVARDLPFRLDEAIIDFQILATELGMTTLIEVHDVVNLLRIVNIVGFPHASYSLLGINNRNLRTMKTSIEHSMRLAEMLEDTSVLVSESGIRTPQDLARLRAHGIHIALVGEHLMKQPDPGAALRELLG